MADNPVNLNIFNAAPGSLRGSLASFSGNPELLLPLAAENAGQATLYTLRQGQAGGRPCLQAFQPDSPPAPPLLRRSAADTALLFFHASAFECFTLSAAGAALAGDRRDMSLLAGFLRCGEAGHDADRQAEARLAAGDLHSAHYLYSAAAARNPASRARLALGPVLLELGLMQEAYDLLKNETDPEALLCLAAVHRRTGNPGAARQVLAGIGPGNFDERKAVESAWLDLDEGREDEAEKAFQRLATAAFDKTEPLAGLGAALAKIAFRTRDRARLTAAAGALRSALVRPTAASARVFFQLGGLYFRTGDLAQAEACYRNSAASAPSPQALANLALALARTGKQQEAAAVTLQVALTDPASARRLTAEFPAQSAAALFPAMRQEPAGPAPVIETFERQRPPERPAPQPAPAPAAEPRPAPALPPQPARPMPEISPRFQPAPALQPKPGLQFMNMAVPDDVPAQETARLEPSAQESASLAPAQPMAPVTSGRRPAAVQQPDPGPAPAPKEDIKFETMQDVMTSPGTPTEAESRKDNFISRAFTLASDLEDELGRKIYFNLDGLTEVEKKLRLAFIKNKENPQANLERVKDTSAFLCYFLQERAKGRLIKLSEFDPWGWPMLFERPGVKLTTYPVQRVWKLLWQADLPEPGWLAKYAGWVGDKLKEAAPPPAGLAAVKSRVMSNPERIADAQTEHKRMLILASSLGETSGIETGRAGIIKLQLALKNNFKQGIPPTTDGWKLLRCYGHIFAAIMAKEFRASWYNTDGEDGGWSMQTPWKTFIFPLGKVYKTAANRDDLSGYFDVLLTERTRIQGS